MWLIFLLVYLPLRAPILCLFSKSLGIYVVLVQLLHMIVALDEVIFLG